MIALTQNFGLFEMEARRALYFLKGTPDSDDRQIHSSFLPLGVRNNVAMWVNIYISVQMEFTKWPKRRRTDKRYKFT